MIPHSRPTLGTDEQAAAAEAVRSGWLAQGPRVQAFERAVAGLIGRVEGVAVNSGTAALELALRALGVGNGDEVIMPSYVCSAPWLAASRVGAQARLVDIAPETYAVSADAVRVALSSRTRAIVVPHPFGLPVDIAPIARLGVPVIEDCAQALGVTVKGRSAGSQGALAVCSFYATKLLCTGEGGMLLCREPGLAQQARSWRDYDEAPLLEAHAYNWKMTEMQAAIGLVQLGRLSEFLARRAEIADTYQRAFRSLPVDLPVVPKEHGHAFFRYVIRLRRRPVKLDAVLMRLEGAGVHCRRPVFRPLHRYLGLEGFPESEQAMEAALSVPLYPSLTEGEIAQVVHAVGEVLA